MQLLVLATVAHLAYGRPQAILPAGLTAAACPNYPFCGAQVSYSTLLYSTLLYYIVMYYTLVYCTVL